MKYVIACSVSVLAAALVTFIGWKLLVTPFASPLARDVVFAVVMVLTYPVRLLGRLAFFGGAGFMCEFCSQQEARWSFVRTAMPVYTFLFMIPAVAATIGSGSRPR